MWLEFNIIDGRADVLSASLLLYDNNNKVILVRGRENILQHRDVIILFLKNVLSNVFYPLYHCFSQTEKSYGTQQTK
jgi:hypothetical protein